MTDKFLDRESSRCLCFLRFLETVLCYQRDPTAASLPDELPAAELPSSSALASGELQPLTAVPGELQLCPGPALKCHRADGQGRAAPSLGESQQPGRAVRAARQVREQVWALASPTGK